MTLYLLFSLLLRLLGFGTSAIWYDEAISRYRALLPLTALPGNASELQGINLWELILRPFAHGPLWMLRLPAFLCSLAAVYVFWRIVKELSFTPAQRTAALIPMVALPGLLWMAQDARYYSAIALCYLLMLWGALSRRQWLLVVPGILLTFIHPVGPVYALSAMLVAFLDRFPIRKLWPCLLVILSWGFILITRDLGAAEFWLISITPIYVLLQSSFAVFGYTSVSIWFGLAAGLWMIVMICTANGAGGGSRPLRVTWLATVLPVAGLIAISLLIKPVYFYRTISPAVPALCLLCGVALAPTRRWWSWILPVTGAALLAVSLANWNPAARGSGLDQAAEFIKGEWRDGDVILYGAGTVAIPFDYYLDLEPVYIIDGPTNVNVTWPGIPYQFARLEDIPCTRAWIIYPQEPIMGAPLLARLDAYAAMGVHIATLPGLQFAPIEIYLVECK